MTNSLSLHDRPLEGQTAIVTGAGRGIGRAVGESLANAGARVFLAARTAREINAAASAIRANGDNADAVACDVSSEVDVRRLFASVRESAGRLDILVNNAGIGTFGSVEEFAIADLDRILAVNVRGAFVACQEAVRLMKPRGSGTIINVASVVGFKGYPNQAAYTASKHALMGLTKSLATETQPHGLRVAAILPGGVDTDLVAKARPDLDRSVLLKPEDIARCVMFLVTLPERAWIDEIYIRRRASAPF